MEDETRLSRSLFLKQASLLGATVIAPDIFSTALVAATKTPVAGNFTFLFQGDSITDGNRSRDQDWNHVMGHGYAYLIAAKWWFDYPAKQFHFFNRGVSGNKITDLAGRWEADTIAVKPDLLSILIGVNDILAAINGLKEYTAQSYETDYHTLLTQTRQQLPDVQFVICEPFALPVGRVKERWHDYQRELFPRQQAVRNLAEEFNAIHVPLQQTFNKALKRAPADYWIWDGIHPMPAGHELIAREWMHRVSQRIGL